MASETDKILALTEMIGSTSPISDDEGKLTASPTTAPVYNKELNKKKSSVVIDEAFMNEKKEQVAQAKNVIDLVNRIGNAGLGNSLKFNEDLATDIFAKNRAMKAINEAIEVLGEDVIDYWAPDESTKQAAPKLKKILEAFSARMR